MEVAGVYEVVAADLVGLGQFDPHCFWLALLRAATHPRWYCFLCHGPISEHVVHRENPLNLGIKKIIQLKGKI